MQNLRKVQNCADALKSLLPQEFRPKIGFVLGTGLGNLAHSLDNLDDSHTIPYKNLPGMPVSTVQSHQGAFVAGTLCGVPVLLQQGRSHLYEGAAPAEVCMGVRVMGILGIRALVITNAAGALNPLFSAGSLMAITDHINMTGQSPLTGPNDDSLGPRFPDMSRVYDQELLDIACGHALRQGVALEKGVYVCVPGPQLETRAETRAYRMLGGDAIGMSTALEAIAAHHMGVRILGLSCLTNKNLPDCMAEADIESIIATAQTAGERLAKLLVAAVPDLAGAV
jgi:purine-nucleoside phosphorylase